ncbi:glycosyltransferase family 2 protein [Mycolicibacterium vaccae]|uniref:glycosyltransferase family 2 protein n=1 Tax=Mycolicibacterium vaccae TaxID=1810 RepID=UPI003D03E915
MTSSKGAVGIQVENCPAPADAVSLSVVICCYTEARRRLLIEAVEAVFAQTRPDDELILVVDGNDALHADLNAVLAEHATVLANTSARGLSGARNTGLHAATGSVVVFLDDDAVLRPGALQAVREAMTDPAICAIGGAVHPAWHAGTPPRWFPPEFGWVVGCDYRGLPRDGAAIRNPIGAAMAVRRPALTAIGGFSDRLGRIDTLPTGCEETLMGIELARREPAGRIVRTASFAVSHAVPRDRATVSYFLRRCFHEGRSKAILSRMCGRDSALASERTYTTRTLPQGIWVARRQPGRAAALLVGLLTTGTGYLVGSVQTVGGAQAGPR